MVESLNFTKDYSTLESLRNKHKPVSQETPVTKPAVSETKTDELDISKDASAEKPKAEPKEKTTLSQKFRNAYATVKKAFIAIGEYTAGTIKGVVYGGITALAVIGGKAIRNVMKNKPPITKGGKIWAGVAATAVFGYQIFKAYLNTNERSAGVDHRWGTGHNPQ